MNDNRTTIGDRIRQKRKELNLTQDELAKKMGYSSRTAISNVEKGGEDLTSTRIQKYADALGCSPAFLMGWQDSTNNLCELSQGNPLLEHALNFHSDMRANEEEYKREIEEDIIIECYRDLDPKEKDLVKRMLKYQEKYEEYMKKRKGTRLI